MKQYYLQTKDEVLKEFKTGSDGLSTKQAEENGLSSFLRAV